MATGKFNAALAAVVAKMQESLTGVEVKSHPGRFTETELGRLVRQKRSVMVAIEDVPSVTVDGDGLRKAELLFAAFVICADNQGADRHESALELVEQIATLLPFNRWDDPAKFRAITPASISADNLYSGEIEKKGIAWWAVSWRQEIS